MRFQRPRIRTILILINLVVLVLPLASIGLLRLYESTLIRKTESSLIAQSAFIASIYKSAIKSNETIVGLLPNDYGNALKNKLNVKNAQWAISESIDYSRRSTLRKRKIPNPDPDQHWKPRYAVLDLSSSQILPRPGEPELIEDKALVIEIKSGQQTSDIMREAQIHTLSGMRVVNAKGLIIASTSNDSGKSILHWSEVKQSLQGLYISALRRRHSDSPNPSITSMSRGTGIRVFVATPIIYNKRVIGAVVISRTPATLAQSLYNNQAMLILLMLGLITIVVVLSFITSFVISKPVQAVAAQAKLVADGKVSDIEILKTARTVEVHELSTAVVKMSKALEKRANYIQNFASQVSHAFKTPLTAIQGAIELLKEHYATMTEQERSQFLSNLDTDSKYLESLVNRLLDLARADTKVSFDGKANINEVLQRVTERANNKNIETKLDLTEDIEAACDPTVLESILQNLIDNSVQHGKPPISIKAELIMLEDNISKQVQITFQDSGSGISAANIKSIFTPFFTTARDQGGTGLGLAVIKTLLENYNGSIEYKEANSGACFVIKFKLGLDHEKTLFL